MSDSEVIHNHRITYRDSGVDIKAGETAVEQIKELASSTFSSDVISSIGGFGGMYRVPVKNYNSPILVSSTDGVGTKAYIANLANKFDTIGQDLVAMCTDDLICCGAKPIYMLDYISITKLVPEIVVDLISGIVGGCKLADCSLIGGEMAEHPNSSGDFNFDLAGFAVGIVEEEKIIKKSMVSSSDILIGLPSYNLRSNGFSLVRKVVFEIANLKLEDTPIKDSSQTLEELLLSPSVVYANKITGLLERHFDAITAIAHITGGGIYSNLQRVLPSDLRPVIDKNSWTKPLIFELIKKLGNVEDQEMDLVFNNGIGLVLVVKNHKTDSVQSYLKSVNQESFIIGELKKI